MRTDKRPWGEYTVLEHKPGYKVKKITVLPGKKLSLQKHMHRSEHWVVVTGTAKVTINNETKILLPNQSVFVPINIKHRLENPGHIDLEIIEVQTGEYLEEDDIIRIEDDYDRHVSNM